MEVGGGRIEEKGEGVKRNRYYLTPLIILSLVPETVSFHSFLFLKKN